MPKFQVTVIKEVWEKAIIDVEAADEDAAGSVAERLVLTDETIEWDCEEIHAIDVVNVEEVEPTSSS